MADRVTGPSGITTSESPPDLEGDAAAVEEDVRDVPPALSSGFNDAQVQAVIGDGNPLGGKPIGPIVSASPPNPAKPEFSAAWFDALIPGKDPGVFMIETPSRIQKIVVYLSESLDSACFLFRVPGSPEVFRAFRTRYNDDPLSAYFMPKDPLTIRPATMEEGEIIDALDFIEGKDLVFTLTEKGEAVDIISYSTTNGKPASNVRCSPNCIEFLLPPPEKPHAYHRWGLKPVDAGPKGSTGLTSDLLQQFPPDRLGAFFRYWFESTKTDTPSFKVIYGKNRKKYILCEINPSRVLLYHLHDNRVKGLRYDKSEDLSLDEFASNLKQTLKKTNASAGTDMVQAITEGLQAESGPRFYSFAEDGVITIATEKEGVRVKHGDIPFGTSHLSREGFEAFEKKEQQQREKADKKTKSTSAPRMQQAHAISPPTTPAPRPVVEKTLLEIISDINGLSPKPDPLTFLVAWPENERSIPAHDFNPFVPAPVNLAIQSPDREGSLREFRLRLTSQRETTVVSLRWGDVGEPVNYRLNQSSSMLVPFDDRLGPLHLAFENKGIRSLTVPLASPWGTALFDVFRGPRLHLSVNGEAVSIFVTGDRSGTLRRELNRVWRDMEGLLVAEWTAVDDETDRLEILFESEEEALRGKLAEMKEAYARILEAPKSEISWPGTLTRETLAELNLQDAYTPDPADDDNNLDPTAKADESGAIHAHDVPGSAPQTPVIPRNNIDAIPLSREDMRMIADAINPLGLSGAHSSLPTVIELRPVAIAPAAYLNFQPGESLVPGAATLRWLQDSRIEGRSSPPGLKTDQIYWYELQAVESHITLRIPVRYRPDREHPFEIDEETRVQAYVTGADPETAVALTDDRLRVHDNGGRWTIELLEAGYEGERIKAFRLQAVTSTVNNLIIGAYNAFDGDGSAESETVYRESAVVATDAQALAVLGPGAGSNLPLHQFSRVRTRVTMARKVELTFFSDADDQGWARLEGVELDMAQRLLRRSGESLILTLGHAEGSETVHVALSASPTGADAYDLTEILPDNARGRVFTWFKPLGTITERPSAATAVEGNLEATLTDIGFPRHRTSSRHYGTKARAFNERAVVVVDPQIKETERRSFEEPASVDFTPSRVDVDNALLALHDTALFPARESFLTALINGRATERMTFISNSGVIFRVPMTQNAVGEFTVQKKNADSALEGAELLMPHPSGNGWYLALPAKYHVRKSSGQTVIEAITGEDQIVLEMTTVTTERTINGKPATGFKVALAGVQSSISRANVRAYLVEYAQVLGLGAKGTGTQPLLADPSYSLGNLLLLDQDELLDLAVISTERGYELAGYETGADGVTRVRGQKGDVPTSYEMERGRDGAAQFDLTDASGQTITLVISDTGKPMIWPMTQAIQHYFKADTGPLKMINLEARDYRSGAESKFRHRLLSQDGEGKIYELLCDMGRDQGASGLSLGMQDGDEVDLARARLEYRVDAEGNHQILSASIKQQGRGNPWQSATVESERYGENRLRLYLQGHEMRIGGYRDYAWLDFDRFPETSAPAAAHYNRTNRLSNTLPSQPEHGTHAGALAMLYGAVTVSPDIAEFVVEGWNDLLPEDSKRDLMAVNDSRADLALYRSALGMIHSDLTENHPDMATAMLLRLTRMAREESRRPLDTETISDAETAFEDALTDDEELRSEDPNLASEAGENLNTQAVPRFTYVRNTGNILRAR